MGLDVSVYKGAKNLKSLCKIEGKKGEVQAVQFNGDRVEKKSKDSPDHLFNLGYFRSSYNAGGFNLVARQLTGMDMYDVFKKKVLIDDSGEFGDTLFVPDWEDAKKKLEDLQIKLAMSDRFRVDTVSVDGAKISSEAEALEHFRTQELESHDDDSAYSNLYGDFSPKTPMQIYGLIKGTTSVLSNDEPCVYVIKQMSDVNWYMTAVGIMIETCDMAINDKNHTYFMYWWG